MILLTVREAADRLGVSPGLIYGLCARRQLRHERYGLGRGTIKIPEDAIDEFRRSVSIGGTEDALSARPALSVKLKHLSL